MNFIEAIKKSITKVRDDYYKRIYGYSGEDLLVIPKTVGTIPTEKYAYTDYRCVIIHDNVTMVEQYAFIEGSLEKIVMGKGITFIGDSAFGNCPVSIIDMTSFGQDTPFPELMYGVFYDIPDNCKIIVPHGRLQELASMTNWSEYADYMVADITTDEIPDPKLLATKDYVDDSNPVKDGVLTLGGTTLNEEQLAQILTISDVENNSLVDLIYPIGSIYITAEDRRPAELFGGTWEQIQGRFLLGAGVNAEHTYMRPLGENGGQEYVQLTVDQIPSHNHVPYLDSLNTSSFGEVAHSTGSGPWGIAPSGGYTQGYRSGTIQTTWTGGDGYHNNMPPYLAVNIWKRTA